MYIPPFTITPEIVNLISDISAQLGRRSALNKDKELLLRRANRIKTIHSSLAIEGNELSEDEVRDIVNGKNIIAPIRQIQEVRNAIRIYDEFESLNPFSETDLLKSHRVLMEALIDNAGHYRTKGVGVYSEKGLVHMAPPASRVPILMAELFEWLKTSKDNLLIRSCVFHYELEFIHPFSDGNGRIGRLWQSLILSKLNNVFQHLPVENIIFVNQTQYYDAIAQSTKEADSRPFIEFMLGEILRTLEKENTEDTTYESPHNEGPESTQKVPRKTVDAIETQALRLLAENPETTRKILAEKTGLSDSGAKKLLARLKAQGRIIRVGSDRRGHWQVVDNKH